MTYGDIPAHCKNCAGPLNILEMGGGRCPYCKTRYRLKDEWDLKIERALEERPGGPIRFKSWLASTSSDE